MTRAVKFESIRQSVGLVANEREKDDLVKDLEEAMYRSSSIV